MKKKREVIFHFMFPLKTPKIDGTIPGMVSKVPVDEYGEPIEDKEEFAAANILKPEEWAQVALYHQERAAYHLMLANFAKTKAPDWNEGETLEKLIKLIEENQGSELTREAVAYAFAGYEQNGPGVLWVIFDRDIQGFTGFVYSAMPLNYDAETEIVIGVYGNTERVKRIKLDRPTEEIAAEVALEQKPS